MTKRYFVAAAKAGRCANGFQNDHGIVRHAVDAEKYTWGSKVKSLCGTRPGVRSVGFVADHGDKEVTCKACLKRLSRIEEYEILDTSKDDASGRALWVHYLSDAEEGNKIIDLNHMKERKDIAISSQLSFISRTSLCQAATQNI